MKRSILSARMVVLLGLLACVCWCAGCGSGGPPTGSVSGKVTFNGQPLTAGIVTFVNEEAGTGASGQLDPSGSYRIESIRTGEYNVAVHQAPPPPDETGQRAELPKLNIPEKYLTPETSGLTATVNEGGNVRDFSL